MKASRILTLSQLVPVADSHMVPHGLPNMIRPRGLRISPEERIIFFA